MLASFTIEFEEHQKREFFKDGYGYENLRLCDGCGKTGTGKIGNAAGNETGIYGKNSERDVYGKTGTGNGFCLLYFYLPILPFTFQEQE